ncbi:recombinase family protein [Streptomyces sp. NPDC052701]|uniref:recombinase family protein n=1 Tax=Streptomyces sp. NPDC052701 TaxID=3155533 RepID=UPI003444353A
MKTTARVRRVGIYVRISDDREGGGLGVKRQEDDCRLLTASLGWKVVEVYVDNDVTAADRRKKRKDYLRMLEDVKSGHIDAVVSWHPDRLYRQPAELEDLIIIVEEHKTEIATVKAGDLDLSTPTGRLVARMLGAIAKYEVEHKQERILRKVQELVAEGKIHNSGHRPFGYTRLYDGKGPRRKILGEILNEDEARWVERWTDRALAGEKLYSLVLDAHEHGVRTTTGGDFTYQAMRTLLMSARISGRKEHKCVIKGTAVWPAIISPEKSDALRALLSARSEEFKAEFGERDATALKHPISGLVRCTCKVPHVVGEPCSCEEEGRQHHKMSTSQRGDKPDTPLYTCRKENGGCGGRTIQIGDLEPLVEKLTFRHLEEIEAATHKDPDDPRPALETKLLNWEKRKAELEDELLDGDRPAREIQNAIDKLNVRMANARRQIAEYGVKANLTEISVAELRKEWADYSIPRKQGLYRSLIREILIHPATRPFNRWNPNRVEVKWR